MALTRPKASQIVSTTIDFSDPLIVINKDQTGNNNKDIGFVFNRGNDTNVALIWDESVDRFAFINTDETGTTAGNVNISSYSNLTIGSLISSGLTYPNSDGTNGQALVTNGSGTLSFSTITPSPAGSNTQVQYNNNGSLGASANLTFNGTTLTSTGFSGPLTGNADTATKWATARTITLGGVLSGNVSIDGSADVTLTAAHTSDPVITLTGDVTGTGTMTNLGNVSITTTVAANSVALGTDTTGNYVQQGATSGNGISGSVNSEGGTFTVTSNATEANTANTIVFRDASGNFSAGTITGALSGNASTATKWATARTITLGGDLTGNVSVDGSADVTLTATVTDDSHNHIISNIDGLQTALDARANLSGATFTGDISGTNLTLSGNLTVSGTTTYVNTTTLNIGDNIITLNADEAGSPSQNAGIEIERGTSTNVILQWNETSDYWEIASGGTTGRILTTGDEGSGNGLDADTLDGQQGTYYLDWTNITNKPDPVVTVTLTGDVTGAANTTLTDLASGTISVSTTIAANSVALGTDTTGNYVATGAVSGNGLSGSASAESATFTVTSNATEANTANTIVFRDASGNFSAGTITASLSGNASTATKWATARTITLGGVLSGNVSVDGSADVTLTAAHTSDPVITLTGDVTGTGTMTNLGNVSITTTIAANSVALGTDTTGNYVSTISAGTGISVSGSGSETATVTITNSGVTSVNSLTGAITATNLLDAIKTVDGSGSGLDADTLDGISSGSFLRSDQNDTMDGTITMSPGKNITYTDKNGTFPTTSGKFEWDLNNDYASIGAQQPASDQIDLTFLIKDNATTGTDRYVFWIDDYQGSTFDTYPAILSGTVNYFMMGDNGSGGPNTSAARLTIPKSGNVTVDGSKILVQTDATDANTASKIVTRDASGNFSAGTITASLTGTASVATTVTLNATNTTNATHYLTFTDAATGNEDIRTDTDLTYNPSTNTLTTTNFAGQATTAKYADLAENYLSDQSYPIGTVLEIGGNKEVTIAKRNSYKVVGTVSEKPGYLMNSELTGDHVIPVAYIGRVPCRVIGKVNRGDCLVPGSIPGVAESCLPQNILPGELVGKALESYDSFDEGVIEILVGRL